VKELFFQKYKLQIYKAGYKRRANSKSNFFGKMIANNAYQEGPRTKKDMRAGDAQKLLYGTIFS
jgi:hypothetical protein